MRRMLDFSDIKRYDQKAIVGYKTTHCPEKFLRNREEQIFNLIYPTHNGIPTEALNLILYDRATTQCVLHDINAFENIVEKELVKCGRTAFVDEHDKILLEIEYLKRKYPKLKFIISETFWPLKRLWVFYSEISNPPMYRDIKALISSGIYYRVLQYFESQKFIERNSAKEKSRANITTSTDPNLLKLTGRIVTLFVLFLLSLLATVLVCFSERIVFLCLASTYLMTRRLNYGSVLGLNKILTELRVARIIIQRLLFRLSMKFYPRSQSAS